MPRSHSARSRRSGPSSAARSARPRRTRRRPWPRPPRRPRRPAWRDQPRRRRPAPSVDAVPPGRLVESLRRQPPVVDASRGRAPPAGRRRAWRGVRRVRSVSRVIGSPRSSGRAALGAVRSVGGRRRIHVRRTRSVAWARLRIEPTLPGLVRRNAGDLGVVVAVVVAQDERGARIGLERRPARLDPRSRRRTTSTAGSPPTRGRRPRLATTRPTDRDARAAGRGGGAGRRARRG